MATRLLSTERNGKLECSLTPEAMCDQQHFAIFPPADLLDDVEVFLDLPLAQALCRQLHQLVDQAAVSQAQLNHQEKLLKS